MAKNRSISEPTEIFHAPLTPVIKTAQAEIQVAPGRFYDVLGAVYHRDTTLVQSMLTYLPAVVHFSRAALTMTPSRPKQKAR